MTEQRLHYRCEAGVATITLDDPGRRNAIAGQTLISLLSAVRRARHDRARVIVIAAEGPYFSVGGDLAAFAEADSLSDFVDDLAEGLHRVVSELLHSDAVVVAVVQGNAAGAGLSLAAAADVVLAAEDATFTFAYGSVGLSHDGGSSMLVHSLGLHRTLRMALLNDRLTAQDALAAGFVARVVPAAELAGLTREVAGRLTRGSAEAQANTKRLLRVTAESSPETVMRRETLAIRSSAATDGREGVAAFLEKRAPSFDAR